MRFRGMDETQQSIIEFGVETTCNPERKSVVGYHHAPPPIFGNDPLDWKPVTRQFFAQQFRYCPATWDVAIFMSIKHIH